MGAEKSKKGSHLTKEERRIIAVLHEEGRSPYEIGKLTGRASNTIRNELKRGTTTIILGYYEKEKYFPDTGQAIYEKNRKRCRKYMVNKFRNFLTYIEEQLQKCKRSFASARAEAIRKRLFKEDEICSISTLYSYTDQGLL